MRMHTTGASLGLVGLAVLLAGGSVLGHHSFAAFDMEKTASLTAVVKEVQWVNPHVWIQLMVTDASGKAVEWSIEANSPSSMSRRGWKPKTLKAGDRITVMMHPMRDGRPGGSLVSVVLADGTALGGSATTETPAPGPNSTPGSSRGR